jgi:peroxin-5
LNALLALGVSYVNELDSHGALQTLQAWVQHNPKLHGLQIRMEDVYGDGSYMDEVMQLMLQAQTFDPTDIDVQVRIKYSIYVACPMSNHIIYKYISPL